MTEGTRSETDLVIGVTEHGDKVYAVDDRRGDDQPACHGCGRAVDACTRPDDCPGAARRATVAAERGSTDDSPAETKLLNAVLYYVEKWEDGDRADDSIAHIETLVREYRERERRRSADDPAWQVAGEWRERAHAFQMRHVKCSQGTFDDGAPKVTKHDAECVYQNEHVFDIIPPPRRASDNHPPRVTPEEWAYLDELRKTSEDARKVLDDVRERFGLDTSDAKGPPPLGPLDLAEAHLNSYLEENIEDPDVEAALDFIKEAKATASPRSAEAPNNWRPKLDERVYSRADLPKRRVGTVIAVNGGPEGRTVKVQWDPEPVPTHFFQFNQDTDLEPIRESAGAIPPANAPARTIADHWLSSYGIRTDYLATKLTALVHEQRSIPSRESEPDRPLVAAMRVAIRDALSRGETGANLFTGEEILRALDDAGRGRESAPHHRAIGGRPTTCASADEQIVVLGREVERLTKALSKLNEIRNSIVGVQGFNFSEHAYPMVAALNEAGFEGLPYPEARANVGTLIERATEAEESDPLDDAERRIRALWSSLDGWCPCRYADGLERVIRAMRGKA